MTDFLKSVLRRPFGCYALAVAVVAAALLLRIFFTRELGMLLPAFIILYPALMLVAILGGLGPGILATALSALAADYFILPPTGHLSIASLSDIVALAFFILMGVLINLLAHRYRGTLRSIALFKAEQALRSSQEQLRQASEYQHLALEAAELGAWEIHLDSRAITGDPICRRFYGFPMDERIATIDSVLERVHPEDRARTEQSFQQALSGADSGVWRQDYRVLWPDGSLHWLTSSGRVHFDGANGDPQPTRFLGVTRDITVSRLAEEMAEESRAMLLAAMASTTDAVLIADLNRHVVHINQAFAAFHRFDGMDQCPRHLDVYEQLFEVYEPDGTQVPETMWSISRALRGESVKSAEYRLRRVDTGDSWWASFSFGPLRDTHGVLLGAVMVARDITENKLAGEALAEYRAKLDAALASMADAVFIADVNGNFIEFNDAFATFHKFSAKAECPASFSAFQELIEVSTLDGEVLPLAMWSSRRALRGETASSVEYRVRRKDTGQAWIGSYSFSPIRDSCGVITGAVIVARDITGRKLAEQAIAEYRARLDVALASMADAVYISDVHGNLIEFNDAFATFHKFRNKAECPKSLAVYRKILELSTPDGQPAPHQMWSTPRALRGETASNVEFLLRRKDTGEKWMGSFSFSPLRDPQGAITGAVVVARDITEIKAAEQKVRESQRTLSLMYQNMYDIVFYMAVEPGPRFRFHSVNPAFLRATGLPQSQVEGKLAQQVIPEPSCSQAIAHYCEAVQTGKTVFWDETTVYPTGEKHADISVSPIFDDKGVCTNLIGVLHDTTEKHRAEEKIRQLNRVYAVLSNINQTIVREKNPQALLQTACRIAVEKGRFLMAWIGMVDPATQVLTPSASSGAVEGYLDQIRIDFSKSSPDSGPAARCFFSGRHAVSNDIERELHRPWLPDALRHGYRSEAAFPLLSKDKVVGIFCLYAAETAFFDDDEIKLLDEMAMDISFALEVYRHEKQRRLAEKHVQQLNRVYAVLSDINQTIVREKDSQGMLQAACRIAIEKGQFRMAWIGMADPETHLLQPVASSGKIGDYLNRLRLDLRDPVLAAGPSLLCFQTGKHVVCNSIERDPAYARWRKEALEHGFRSSASFPLLVDGRVVGVFNLYAGEPEFFVGDELSLLDEMAMDISFALEVNLHDSERQKADSELRWRTAFFEAQVESSIDGVLVVDAHNTKILQNRRLNEMMRLPEDIAADPDDTRQRTFVSRFIKEPDRFLEKIDYLNSHPDEVTRDEVELVDGTILDRYSAPVRDKAGAYYGRIWTFRDITQSRQFEEQSRQAQKMESIGQLTGGIAHDFNNLLTVILGCSEFLGEELKENPRQQRMARMILEAAQRGAELTHRMLAFARRQALKPQPVDVNQLITNLESFLSRTLNADIELRVLPAPVPCTALIDPTQLESALLNLCVNARDAMTGGGKLIVETGRAALDADYAAQNPGVIPGEYVLVAVSDTGSGIDPEIIDRVFDPFFTTKSVGRGTGLGLSMVYGFAKQSQGHVKIYSELGRGTSVKLYLPIAAEDSLPIPLDQEPPVDLRGSELVLLVEDNAPVREYAHAQLLHLGYRVLEAGGGREALEILAAHPEIALLFTDVVMPGMNGHELATAARNLKPGLKVLYCSGYAEHAAMLHGALDGAEQLLNKPYSRIELARKMRMILDEGAAGSPGRPSHV
jgi:PAS domain S-box-containing protein